MCLALFRPFFCFCASSAHIHHVELALTYAKRIIGIRAGKIVFDGPSADVTQDVLDTIYEGHIPQSEGEMP